MSLEQNAYIEDLADSKIYSCSLSEREGLQCRVLDPQKDQAEYEKATQALISKGYLPNFDIKANDNFQDNSEPAKDKPEPSSDSNSDSQKVMQQDQAANSSSESQRQAKVPEMVHPNPGQPAEQPKENTMPEAKQPNEKPEGQPKVSSATSAPADMGGGASKSADVGQAHTPSHGNSEGGIKDSKSHSGGSSGIGGSSHSK